MLGEADFAVSNACFKVNYLLIAPMEGFAVAASTVVARFQGMGDADGAARNALKTLVLGLCVVVLLSVGAVVFREPVLRLFSPPGGASGEAFVGTGSRLFVLMAVWQVFDAADVILSGALKGAGDTRFVFRWMAAAAFGFWLPLVGVVCLLWPGICALWGTMVVYVAVICAGTSIRFARGAWRRHRLV